MKPTHTITVDVDLSMFVQEQQEHIAERVAQAVHDAVFKACNHDLFEVRKFGTVATVAVAPTTPFDPDIMQDLMTAADYVVGDAKDHVTVGKARVPLGEWRVVHHTRIDRLRATADAAKNAHIARICNTIGQPK